MAGIRNPLYIINTSLPMGMVLTPNANNVTIRDAKVYNSTRTIGGFVYEHWGDNPGQMTVHGITFSAKPRTPEKLFAYVRLLRALYKLDKTEFGSLLGKLAPKSKIAKDFTSGQITERQMQTLSETVIYYDYNIYTGFFTDFTLTEDAIRPDIYIYNFAFMITGSAEDYMRNNSMASQITALLGFATPKGQEVTQKLTQAIFPSTRRLDT